MSMIISFFGTTFLSYAQVYVWYNLLNKKFPYKDKLIHLKIISLDLLVFVNHNYCNNFIKGFITLILAITYCRLIIKLNIKKSILLCFLSQLIIIVIESIIFMIFMFVFGINASEISETVIFGLILDFAIALMSILISRFKIVKKVYNLFTKITETITMKQVLPFILFVALGTNIFSTSIYFNGSLLLKLILNISISLIYTVIVILVFNYQNKYYKINYKYKLSVEDINSKKSLINEYRIMNHENNNNLNIIKSMTNNKKVIKYINTLLKQKKSITNKLIIDSLKIPQGSMSAIVYSKILVMKEKNIKYFLNVDNDISIEKISTLTDEDFVDICNILGVFLDNAIDESENVKDIVINISFQIENDKLVIMISNKHNHSFNGNTLNLKSSKGNDRGYGLQLVKRIVANNSKIENYRMISKDIFSQKIIINI